MIETVWQKNQTIKNEITQLQQIITNLYSQKKISDDDFNDLYERTENIKNKFMEEKKDEESYYINIENNHIIYSYRLVLNSSTTENEIKKAIRQVETKIRNVGVPVYKEYVDYIIEETCKKNKWQIEKFSEHPITEHI